MKTKIRWPRLIRVCLIATLIVVFLLRKKIIDHPMTQKKMELMKAIYKNEPDSAKMIIEEMVDSSFYIK